MELCIKKNELSLSERFDIYDMNGNSVYYVTRKIALKHKVFLYDMNNRCIAEIKQCSFHSLSSFLIMLEKQKYHLIQKFRLFRTHVFLKEKEWE